MDRANQPLLGLPARLTKEDEAATFKRLATSQHVADLQLIFFITIALVILLSVLVIVGGSYSEANFAGFLTAAGILGTGASILAWTYQTGSARLGIVDLFACEITTLCRVCAITEVAPNFVKMYDQPPPSPPPFLSQEQYMPVFDHNSKDLEVLEARVVEHVTEFYTYLKALRDYLRMLSTIDKPQDRVGEWRIMLRNALYMLFLMLESGREATRQLVEYEPEREQNIITILLSEVVTYGLLLREFEAEAKDHPGYNAKLERLRLRRPGYVALVCDTAARVREQIQAKDYEAWRPAEALLGELEERYRDAFSALPPPDHTR